MKRVASTKSLPRVRRLLSATLMLVASSWCHAQARAPSEPLTDCRLFEYGSTLDIAVARTLRQLGALWDVDVELKAAATTGRRVEVTGALYRAQLLLRVTTCSKPVVRAFVEGHTVAIELAALQGTVCDELLTSESLRSAGYLVLPHHVPSGQPRCGMARNVVPNVLTLGRLTQAGRMLPGENVVTVTARGPFRTTPGVVPPGRFQGVCPTLDGQRDPTIETIIDRRQRVSIDYPRRWSPPSCIDLNSGAGASSMGVCTTAQWNRYHSVLYDEFERIIARAEASRDPTRIFSAAYWLIEQSDPAKYTVLRHDYDGLECDLIRNRIVVSYGTCVWDRAKALALAQLFKPGGGFDFRVLWEAALVRVIPQCVIEIPAGYKDADDLLNRVMRPVPYPEVRQQVLERVRSRVMLAMERSNYGRCPYYGDAIYRLDERIWEGQVSQPPPVPDWEHDFWTAAKRCMAN